MAKDKMRVELRKKDFEEILNEYDIGIYKKSEYMKHIHENNVYILWTSRGKFILKDLINVDLKNYSDQLEFIDFLYKNGVKVALNIKTKNGHKILNYDRKNISIQKFKQGIHPKRFSLELVKNVAKNVALMNKISLNSKYRRSIKKKFKSKNLTGILDNAHILKIQRDNLKRLRKIDQNKLRACRIHGDLCEVNILVKGNNVVSFIDFDDSNFGFIIYEIAIFIAHSFIKRRRGIDRKKISVFLEEYEKIIKLNPEEKSALYPLILYRFFGMLYWYKQYYPKDKNGAKEFDHGIKRISDIIELFSRCKELENDKG